MLVSRLILPRDAVRHGPGRGLGRNHISPTTLCRRSLSAIVREAREAGKTGKTREAADARLGSDTLFHWRHRRQSPKYLSDSPNATLAMRRRSRTAPLTFATWQRVERTARSPSTRLPVMTLQMQIRLDEQQMQTSLSESLCSETQWRARLNSLAFKGIQETDLREWLWVLAGRDSDERIARLVASDRPKPIFLLFQLLRRDEVLRQTSSLQSLHDYVGKYHVYASSYSSSSSSSSSLSSDNTATTTLPFGAVRRTLDSSLNMTPPNFVRLLSLLAFHYRRLWPSALPALARLASAYIVRVASHGRSSGKRQERAFSNACFLFNEALVIFQRRAPEHPLANMQHNWQAQKELLAMSTQQQPRPLLINRAGFRSIRQVMLALGKSPAERRVAQRMVRTWPPYRRDWDGLDEKRQPADDFGRSVQAGELMREAGYAELEHDRALSVLGGSGPIPGASAPTVQTRSLSPRLWSGSRASHNVLSTWAARIRATRDVNEAWQEFQQAPAVSWTGAAETASPIPPSAQVYAELFQKLVAAPLQQHPGSRRAVLPGDGREVLPVNDGSLTAFEKERLRPPSNDALYAQMLSSGTRPVGNCLSVLLRHAPTLGAAMRYLQDSPLDRTAVAALRPPCVSCSPDASSSASSSTSLHQHHHHHHHHHRHKPPALTYALLRNIPLGNLTAYVHLLCRFQPRLTQEPARLGKLRRTELIHHAIHICMQRLPGTQSVGQAYRAPWHTILHTLAQPKLLVSAESPHDRRFHDQASLELALRVFSRVQSTARIDVAMLDSLCRTVLKCLRWTDVVADDGQRDDDAAADESAGSTVSTDSPVPLLPPPALREPLLAMAHAAVVSAFEQVTQLSSPDASADRQTPHPATSHALTASHLQAYLQTLGYLGDTDRMVQTVQWILHMWDTDGVLEDAKDMDHGQHATLGRVLVMFRAFVESRVPANLLAQLEQQLHQLAETRGCTWRWPSREDADAFVQWHRRDHTAAFWLRTRPSCG